MGKLGKSFAKTDTKDYIHSIAERSKKKMIGKQKFKSKSKSMGKYKVTEEDNAHQSNNSSVKSPTIKKFPGVKRKFEESDSQKQNNPLQDLHGSQKCKKRKLKGQGPLDTSDVKENNTKKVKSDVNSNKDDSVDSAPRKVAEGFKNKMNVTPDKNWKALLKILPKDTPKKKEVQKKPPNRKTWRKPPMKQLQKVEQSKGDSSKCSADSVPKKIKREDIWFDDVDELLIEGLENDEESGTLEQTETVNPLVKDHSFEGATKAVAMDCEMVGVGEDGQDSILARVSIVNRFGHVLLDKYVKPREKVTDYRTHVSGIRPSDLKDAEDFAEVQKQVHTILKGKVLVGHALHNDMQVLFLDHPRKLIRDTARYKPFRKLFNGRIPSLKNLSAKLLSVEVQSGEHSSVQDAQAAMRIYTMRRAEWEKSLKSKISERPISKRKRKAKTEMKNVHNPLESDSDS